MITTEVICNRCGKKKTLVTKNDIMISFAKIDLWGVGQHRTDAPQRIDLCESCYEKFINYLESDGREDDNDG